MAVAALGRWCVVLGLVLLIGGGLLILLARLGFPTPTRLPGDLTLQGRGWVVYLPLGTSVALSLALSVVLYTFASISKH